MLTNEGVDMSRRERRLNDSRLTEKRTREPISRAVFNFEIRPFILLGLFDYIIWDALRPFEHD